MSLDASIPGGSYKQTIHGVLLEKHPVPSAVTHSTILTPNPDSYVPCQVLFDAIDGPFIHSVVLKMDSSAGPCGLDAAGWKHLCTSCHAHSNNLCDSIAILM